VTNPKTTLRRQLTHRILTVTLLVLALFISASALKANDFLDANDPLLREKISPWFLTHFHATQENGFLVLLNSRADLSGIGSHVAREDRLRLAHETLFRTAEKSQNSFRIWLESRGIRYRPYFIANMVLVYGPPELVHAIAVRSDVWRIEGNQVVEPMDRSDPWQPLVVSVNESQKPTGTALSAIEWNLSKVRVPEVWSSGVTGTGIVVAGHDTGVQWDHPALREKYRGWDSTGANHDYNWHDAIHEGTLGPCGFDSTVPCDDHGHGTHTLGTIVGDDGEGNQIGVAPGAKWIACRNMNNGRGTTAEAIECFEFFLAPYPVGGNPSQGDPSKAPHIINNSWGIFPPQGSESLKLAIENLRAAGIVVVVSAGNWGSNCGTIGEPAHYEASFSVGATDSYDHIASFSSRGPTTFDDSNRLKPDISAPGVKIRSSFPPDTYASRDGTSMAAPHAVGAVALLWSAVPDLMRDVDTTELLLKGTAVPRTANQTCGDILGNQIPNNIYGWGRLDVLAAVQTAQHGPLLVLKKEGSGAGAVISDPPGIDCGFKCIAAFVSGSTISFTAVPDSDSVFSHWSGACTGTENPCQITITGNADLTATFSPSSPLLQVTQAGSGSGTVVSDPSGIDCGLDCSEPYEQGTTVNLTARPDASSRFFGWSGGGCSGTGTCVLSMNADTNVSATFTSVSPTKIVLLSPNGGERIPSGSSVRIEWEAPLEAKTFNLFYSIDSGATWGLIDKDITQTTAVWTVPLLSKNKTKCLVRVVGLNQKGKKVRSDKSNHPFTIEVVTITSPTAGEELTSGVPERVTWVNHVKAATTAKLFYSLNNGLTWKEIPEIIDLSVSPSSYDWTPPWVLGGKDKCKMKIVLKDAMGGNVGRGVSEGRFRIVP
jgi:serine protease AprX